MSHEQKQPPREASQQPKDRRQDLAEIPRYAAVDLGTHNCRMLIAEASEGVGLRVIDAFSRSVRLGEGLEETRRLGTVPMRRALNALRVCADRLRTYDVVAVRGVATEACRRAENGSEFLDRVAAETGLVLKPIAAAEEVSLTVAGCSALFDSSYSYVLMLDIGGGSTEIVWVKLEGKKRTILGFQSLKIGVVTLSERFGRDRVEETAYRAMVEAVDSALSQFDTRFGIGDSVTSDRAQVVGASGTLTTVAAVHLGLKRYDRSRVDGLTIDARDVKAAISRLSHSDFATRAAIPCIGSDRADVVVAGCAILEAICRRTGAPRLTVADRGIREGLLLSMIEADDASTSDTTDIPGISSAGKSLSE